MMKRFWSEEQIKDIINLYTINKWTLKEISIKYATKPDTISKLLKENGIEIRRQRTINKHLIENYFETIDTEEKAYFIGFLFADGNITKDRQGKRQDMIRIEVSEKDLDIIEKFKKELNLESKITTNKRANRKNTVSIGVRSNQLSKDLSIHNIIPNKTYEIENLSQKIPLKFESDYLRGLLDGDGSIYKSNNLWSVSFCGYSEKIVEEFHKRTCELINRTKYNKVRKDKSAYRISLVGKDALLLLDKLYSNSKINLTRKAELALTALENKMVEDIV